ncbi:hypothetical protein LEP1GSC024_4978 [Leptospira noguchii str. 2001034031]|uniref:Uncharacterized protein n=1 Tax=Leptospira noguchii str. 2001034031 TaxID=1193053 RepID=M6YB46_9LEPT|nr:hypothetical protein LEP1GSC024_4978 [Leptospira noguchii str. 2001034031]
MKNKSIVFIFLASLIFYTLFYSEHFNSFWKEVRGSILAKDFKKLEDMNNFSLFTRESMNEDSIIKFKKSKFIKSFVYFLPLHS